MQIDFSNNQILIDALNKGNTGAFEYIYKTFYSDILNYATRLVSDREAAQDIVQNTYYRLWENRKKLILNSSIKSYLYKAVYNNCLNSLAHQKNINKYEDEKLKDLYISTVLQQPEVEELLERQEIESALNNAIEQLPSKCREIFLLSKREGFKNREIAEQLNISIKTVESQITIAIKKLREDLGRLLQIFLFF